MTAPRWTGCPCGCASTETYDDPECWRHRPVPQRGQPPEYDVETLGLVPHDRGMCPHCQAVGA